MAISSAEAEFYALSTGIQATRPLNDILEYMQSCLNRTPTFTRFDETHQLPDIIPIKINMKTDSMSASFAASTDKITELRKHIGIKLAFVNELSNNGKINVSWISRDHNPADGLCKVLPAKEFNEFKTLLFSHDLHRVFD